MKLLWPRGLVIGGKQGFKMMECRGIEPRLSGSKDRRGNHPHPGIQGLKRSKSIAVSSSRLYRRSSI